MTAMCSLSLVLFPSTSWMSCVNFHIVLRATTFKPSSESGPCSRCSQRGMVEDPTSPKPMAPRQSSLDSPCDCTDIVEGITGRSSVSLTDMSTAVASALPHALFTSDVRWMETKVLH